jgi:hypothetical protein
MIDSTGKDSPYQVRKENGNGNSTAPRGLLSRFCQKVSDNPEVAIIGGEESVLP